MPFGTKPEGAYYYACDGKYEFTVWSPPPPPGDKLCRTLTGKSEAQLVRDILDGKYNYIFERKAVVD